jgi:hypothetical protein
MRIRHRVDDLHGPALESHPPDERARVCVDGMLLDVPEIVRAAAERCGDAVDVSVEPVDHARVGRARPDRVTQHGPEHRPHLRLRATDRVQPSLVAICCSVAFASSLVSYSIFSSSAARSDWDTVARSTRSPRRESADDRPSIPAVRPPGAMSVIFRRAVSPFESLLRHRPFRFVFCAFSGGSRGFSGALSDRNEPLRTALG